MPKYRKVAKKEVDKKKKQEELQNLKFFMFSTALKGYIVAGVFLVLSLLFNGQIVPLFTESSTALKVVNVLIKGGVITCFFLFIFVSFVNLRELRGKVSEWPDIVLLSVISILQGILDGWVVLTSTIGIVLLLVYVWLMQVKLEK
ncbi:MAG: hypothetical protein ACTSU5_04030 [Promethearchaeota archaeon]